MLGTIAGSLDGATRAVVTGQSQADDGTIRLNLAHDFVIRERGSLRTLDSAVWTPIPGHDGVFHMGTDYSIEGRTGNWAGTTGSLRNEGIADTVTGLVTLRDEGEICCNLTAGASKGGGCRCRVSSPGQPVPSLHALRVLDPGRINHARTCASSMRSQKALSLHCTVIGPPLEEFG